MTELFPPVGDCVLSKDQKHRYMLSRTWDKSKPSILFIGLNPSRADDKINDPTITRCIGFARRWGYGQLFFGNLYSFRTPYPEQLVANLETAYDEQTDYHLKKMISESERVICAWGCWTFTEKRVKEVLEMIPNPYCLGKNKDGSPKHPLYLANTTQFTVYIP
jgi:hypothetical protein